MQQPATYDDLAFTERLSLLVDHEIQCRRQRRQQRLIRAAGFRVAATLNDVHYGNGRNLERRQIAELGQCDWIGRSQNLLVTGPCGCGKTYLNLEWRLMWSDAARPQSVPSLGRGFTPH